MKLLLTALFPMLLPAQIFSFGVKGGLPLTAAADSLLEGNRSFEGTVDFVMPRYAFGPTVEAKIPFGFRVEVDGLYQHIRTTAVSAGYYPLGALTFQSTTASAWEIPMLLKHRFGRGPLTTYASAGATLRHIGDLSVNEWINPGNSPSFTHATYPSGEPIHAGITFGGGVSFKVRSIRFEPELRYTHWTSDHYLATTEQVDVLMGITFSPRVR